MSQQQVFFVPAGMISGSLVGPNTPPVISHSPQIVYIVQQPAGTVSAMPMVPAQYYSPIPQGIPIAPPPYSTGTPPTPPIGRIPATRVSPAAGRQSKPASKQTSPGSNRVSPMVGTIFPRDSPMETTSDGTVGSVTVTSLDEQEQKEGEDPIAAAVVDELRHEPTDRAVRSRVMKLPHAVCMSALSYLEKRRRLVLELCLKERGNIVCHLMERLGGEQCSSLVKMTLDHFLELATSQSGCIALPRIMEHVTALQLDMYFTVAMQNADQLFCHPFGNFVVKHFVTLPDSTFIDRLCNWLCTSEEAVRLATTNKFGSHLVDDMLRGPLTPATQLLIARIFANLDLLRLLSHDPFGNYVVQSAFRHLNQSENGAQLLGQCVNQVIQVVSTSPYQQNIMKTAVGGFRTQKQSSSPSQLHHLPPAQ